MCNGNLEKLIRPYGKSSQRIRRAVIGNLPEHSINGERDKLKRGGGVEEKRHKGSM